MKKNIIFALLSTSIVFASCSDFLTEDPKGSITPVTFYNSAEDLNSAMVGIALTYNLAWNQTGGMAITFGSDDITTHAGGNKKGFSDFDTFQATSSNDRMAIWWTYFYKTIKSSNSLISNYSKATKASEEQRNNAAGVAYFYRALNYFFLTRAWGDVPMPLEFSLEEKENSTPAEVYAQVIEDLKKAESMLPDRWTGPRRQENVDIMPTKGSAKALLANVYLTSAGWPLKITANYALAAQKAKEVIDQKATWGYDLLPSFADLWDKDHQFNKEAVFGVYFNKNTPTIWTYGDNWGNGSQLGPPNFAPGEEGGWDEAFGEIDFYNRFPAGPRKDATYQKEYFLGNDPNKVVDYKGLTHKHPYFMKYRDDASYDPATHKMNDWWGNATVYMIRYSEVLLTYAEAKAMSSGVDASAYDAVNQVRKRAGLPNLTSGLSAGQFQAAVIEERGWEFAGFEPAARWYDLIRTETVEKVAKARKSEELPLVGQPSDASHTFYWAPLPINR
ncbi:RagB/SusD family nutrient uptake outer membrane protein [Sphingobacterium sp. DK4209]|uniref:RagB/SusD family nutrient uptake outer membrane protein n=1 Tax=Sphingobacterium zhuxiongii TaxID=2662364 RepID=A0A5Q0QFT4_9SPHI|nr:MULTISPECIES: RagB/SusD family nutrient uptake outer membrane protein [unclassified Sphingobacterium]MVZ66494.1 RagB/SusD family nutrient uptake outer membrane protein [Sphingobacterium sp. DK4209]QGA27851.1 RagB/SusD family nutrient uptake outer membrane protein [Sphingobacterium sp. dk4302]